MLEGVPPMFSSSSFIVSNPKFISLIYFEFTFVYSVRKRSSCILLQAVDQFSQHHLLTAAAAKSLQSCLTLCTPIDGSPSGSPVPGILQARTLEWAAISFSNA